MPESVTVATMAMKLERVAGQVDQHLVDCAKANVQTAAALAKVADKLDTWDGIVKNAWKALGTVLVAIVASVSAILAQNAYLHHVSSVKQDKAEAAASVAATAAGKAEKNTAAIANAVGAPATQ